MCVSSCKNIVPSAFIYTDNTDLDSLSNPRKKCKVNCNFVNSNSKYSSAILDPDNPVCVANCP